MALEAIKKMLTISGEPVFAPDGRLLRGTVVRLLLLPGHLLEAKTALSRVYRACGNSVITPSRSELKTATPRSATPPQRVLSPHST